MNRTNTDINVLIVSRDPKNTTALKASLPATGLPIKGVRTAMRVDTALKMYLKKKPSVVFFEISREEDLAQFAGLSSLNPGVAIIVITDKKYLKFAYNLLGNGATDFFKKSRYYDPVILEKSIRFSIENRVTAESLRLSNERYELVSKATNDMVWDWDLLNNKVFRSADGWDKVIGKTDKNESEHTDSWWDRVHPADKPASNATLEKVLKDKAITYFEMECRILRNDNSYASVIDRGYAVRNEQGEVTRLIGATQDVTEKKAAEEKLTEERRVRQDEITAAVITAQEREREGLGKELHDNINQILATSKLYIEYSLTNEEMRGSLLSTAKGLIESAVAEIRNLSKSLSPPSLGEVGLIRALNELIDSVRPVNKFLIATKWDGISEDNLPEELKLTVFRIIQEQLTNISKHAHAKRVWITMRKDSKNLRITIKDNGDGFDPKEKVTGVGLKNIFSRAQLHNGKAELITQKGKGVRLTVIFKLWQS